MYVYIHTYKHTYIHTYGVLLFEVKSNHVNSKGSYNSVPSQKQEKQGGCTRSEDDPEPKSGVHGPHPTDVEGQAKFIKNMVSMYPSKWADNIYSRKFGPTIDEGGGSHAGGLSESAAPKKRLRTCNPNFVQPKQDESKNRDDETRDDDNDNDDKESEKTLILGAD